MCTSGKGISGRGSSNCEGCEAALCSHCLRNSKRLTLLEWGSASERYPVEQSYTWMRRPSHSLCLTQGAASWRRWYVRSSVTTE